MKIINGKKYAKNNKEYIQSLFKAGGTCVGFYKETKANPIHILTDNQRNIITNMGTEC